MSAISSIKLTLDSSAFTAAMDSARELLEARPEFVEFFLGLINSPSEIGRFESESATRANLIALLKPTDLFLDFLAALSAVDGKVRVTEKTHD